MRIKPKPQQGLLLAQSFLPKGRTTWARSEGGKGKAYAGSVLSTPLCWSCFFSWKVWPQQGTPGTVSCSGIPQGFFHRTKAPRQSSAPTLGGDNAVVAISHPLYGVTGGQSELENLIPYRVCVLVPLAIPRLGGEVRQGFVWLAGANVWTQYKLNFWQNCDLSNNTHVGNLETLLVMVFPLPICLSNSMFYDLLITCQVSLSSVRCPLIKTKRQLLIFDGTSLKVLILNLFHENLTVTFLLYFF